MPAPRMLVALQAFAANVNDTERFVTEGELVPADDPIVKGRESLFADADTRTPTQ